MSMYTYIHTGTNEHVNTDMHMKRQVNLRVNVYIDIYTHTHADICTERQRGTV